MARKSGWFGESQRHSLASRGVRTGTKNQPRTPRPVTVPLPMPDLSQSDWPIRGQMKITPSDLEQKLKGIYPFMRKNGIYPLTGDCASFAVALGNALEGGGEYVCSYASEDLWANERPSHCAVRYEGRLWDVTGETTEDAILKKAQGDPDAVHGEEMIQTTYDEQDMSGILEKDVATKAEKLVRKYFHR